MPASMRSASSDVKSRTSTDFIVVLAFPPPICMFQIEPEVEVETEVEVEGEDDADEETAVDAEPVLFFAYPILHLDLLPRPAPKALT